jgi:TetR/AcrR family acrAB operon transcriptional repressor
MAKITVAFKPAAADTRTRILRATQQLLSELGSADFTVADVAARADVSRGTVFNQFGSKHGLIEAVTEAVYAGYEAILEKALTDRKTPVPVLVRKLFEVMGNAIEEGGSFYRTVLREISRIGVGLEEGGASEQARHRVVGLVVHLLTRGQARGELDPKLDPDDLATAFDSLVFGTLSHWLYADPSSSLRERMLAASRIFLGPVATQSVEQWEGPEPDLSVEGDFGPN